MDTEQAKYPLTSGSRNSPYIGPNNANANAETNAIHPTVQIMRRPRGATPMYSVRASRISAGSIHLACDALDSS